MESWLPKAFRESSARSVPTLYSWVVGGSAERSSVKKFHILYRDAILIARSLDVEEVRRAFDRDVPMRIGEMSKNRVFVHAGVVAFEDGVVLVPGKSLSGKTSLVKALAEHGGTYYSDDLAVIDSRGMVSPWAEPLSIRTSHQKPGVPAEPRALGMKVGRKKLPIRLVVITSFIKKKRFLPAAQTPAAGVLALLENSFSVHRRPRANLATLSRAMRAARVLKGPRGDAKDAATIIAREMRRRA